MVKRGFTVSGDANWQQRFAREQSPMTKLHEWERTPPLRPLWPFLACGLGLVLLLIACVR